MKTPEGKIKDQVKALLTEVGAYQFWPVQMGYGKRTLDCLACVYGTFVAIETKAPGKKLTGFQAIIKNEIVDAQGDVFVVSNDKELEELRAWLKHLNVFS